MKNILENLINIIFFGIIFPLLLGFFIYFVFVSPIEKMSLMLDNYGVDMVYHDIMSILIFSPVIYLVYRFYKRF